jgi:uncharacterized membrane protein (DUF2068 family)
MWSHHSTRCQVSARLQVQPRAETRQRSRPRPAARRHQSCRDEGCASRSEVPLNAIALARQSLRAASGRRRRDRWLTLIALFKLLKAALLVAVGFGALRLLEPSVAARIQEWLAEFSFRSGQMFVQRAISWIARLTPERIELLGLGAFAYASLFAVEGVGLWLGRRWAEYLTVIATGSLVPFELYELARHFSALRLLTLSVNLAVVAYLIFRLRHPPSE